MKKLIAVAITLAVLSIPLQDAVAQEATLVTYRNGTSEYVKTPQDWDQWENLQESLDKGCGAWQMFEDYSCIGPNYTQYTYTGE